MPKKKYITDNAFFDVVQSKSFDDFINIKIKSPSKELLTCEKKYANMVKKNKSNLESIALVEETIIQLRCRDEIDDKIKLSVVRGYVYARAPFIQKGKKSKDIRIIIGKTSVLGDNINDISNGHIMDIAKLELQKEMTKIITDNLNKIKTLNIK